MFKLSPKALILNSNEVRSREVRVVGEEGYDCLLNADIIHSFISLNSILSKGFLIKVYIGTLRVVLQSCPI